MFKKILIVEGLDTISLGLSTSLAASFPAEITTAKSGDNALVKIKKSVQENLPYELIITSLSFTDTIQNDQIENGEELIAYARKILPDVKVMVYSIENKPFRIYRLFYNYKINAFVAHGRESMPEIIDTVKTLNATETVFISPKYLPYIQKEVNNEIEEYDIKLLNQLAFGKTQTEISTLFKEQGTPNSSTSSIEKRINKLRMLLKANNTISLIATAKDMGII